LHTFKPGSKKWTLTGSILNKNALQLI
jgi:hypothetical protein